MLTLTLTLPLTLVQATGLGSLLASAVAAALHASLGDAQVRAWGWRIPFVLGAALALVSFHARRAFRPTQARLTSHHISDPVEPSRTNHSRRRGSTRSPGACLDGMLKDCMLNRPRPCPS